MSFQASFSANRTRQPTCTLCRNHGIRSDLKGHKYYCEFSDCECKLCFQGRERREVMRQQVQLRRRQMKQIYSSMNPEDNKDNVEETSSGFKIDKAVQTDDQHEQEWSGRSCHFYIKHFC